MSQTTPPVDGGPEALPGLEHLAPKSRLEEQRSFGALVVPSAVGLSEVDFGEVSQAMIDAADPKKLRGSLIDVKPSKTGNNVSYFDPIQHKRIHLALTPREYGFVMRSVSAFGDQAVANTLTSKEGLVTNQDEVDAKAARSGIHQVGGRMELMQRHLDESLLPDRERLERFSEYARHHWYSRRKEVDMRIELTWIRDHIFGNMFTALRYQRGWNDEQERKARLAVDWRLFFMRKENKHVANWHEMLDLAHDYSGNKIALFRDRIHEAKKYKRVNQPR